MADGKPYVLPLWRINEIILIVMDTLGKADYDSDSFDYTKMIKNEGIKLRKFSSFTSENLEAFRKISLSLWTEGVCTIFPDPITGEKRCMIAYRDNENISECMHIIFHEFAHIKLHHTQQSINGEVEATCFSLAMTLFILMGQVLNEGKTTLKNKGKPYLMQGIKTALKKKEVI